MQYNTARVQQEVDMYECFHCGGFAVVWDSDFDFEDFGREDEGVVHVLHCEECGATVYYFVPIDDGEESDNE